MTSSINLQVPSFTNSGFPNVETISPPEKNAENNNRFQLNTDFRKFDKNS